MVCGLLLAGLSAVGAERPNILWLTCEDISPYLGCYGFEQAQTPNIDRLAEQGVRFTRAYANAPVCAVARSTLLTGMYASTIGTHQMRSVVQLPESIPAYPRIFREAGYYCTNNSKKDYNSNLSGDKTIWDESSRKAHWKNRKEGQPFFAVFNTTVTHESQLSEKRIAGRVKSGDIPAKPRISPSDIELPPYHPDLPEIRQDWARLHDLITLMDGIIGAHLKELEQAGLADDTIIFFYSDHGGQLARSKRFIYNVGTQVPLIVRVPKKWQHLAPSKPGATSDRLVSFIDFPKTALSLAGLDVPEAMQGTVFLGPEAEKTPASVHFFRDRMASRNAFSRAVTDGRYYYIRNFMPHRPRGRDSYYGYTVQANWRAWRAHYEAGGCNAIQAQFYEKMPSIQFFDTENDPWHVTNLEARKAHQQRMNALEEDLDRWMIKTRDVGLIPEPLFYDLVGPDKEHKTLYAFAQSDRFDPKRVLEVAKDVSMGDPKRVKAYLEFMQDKDPIVRHYGAYGIFLAPSQDAKVSKALKDMMSGDIFGGNRVMAAQALALCGDPEAAFAAIMKEARATQLGYVFLQAINAFQYSHTDDRLTREDWAFFKTRAKKGSPGDRTGWQYSLRIIDDALAIWPERRRVY